MGRTLPNPAWGEISQQLLRRVESAFELTVFGDGPSRLATMPDALGGDPGQREALAAKASSTQGFLNILRAKAHFLVLPEQMLDEIRDADVPIVFSDVLIGGEANTRYLGDTALAIQLGTDLPLYLAGLGGDLGRRPAVADTAPLNTIYHELCHAWMVEVVADDPFWQDLRAQGGRHYANSVTANGRAPEPDIAYLEAAGSYVGARLASWLSLLQSFSTAALLQGQIPDERLAELLTAARLQYDTALQQDRFGYVDESPILDPGLPPALRQALDAYPLASLPLTRRFGRTPLKAVDDTRFGGAAGGGGGVPPPVTGRTWPSPEMLTEIATRPRLAESYQQLVGDGWQLRRRNIWLANADTDTGSTPKALWIDDDNEPTTTLVDWLEQAVKMAYRDDADYRRSTIRDHALPLFRRPDLTALQKMADLYEWAVWFWADRTVFVKPASFQADMVLVLTEFNDDLLGKSDERFNIFSKDRLFYWPDTTGFRRDYRAASNQVRHATGAIQAVLTYGVPGLVYLQLREILANLWLTDLGPADYRLNQACSRVASGLASGRTALGDVGYLVRALLGDPAETAPYTGPVGGYPDP